MRSMIKLSFTTANALINSSHTWLNKINGLQTFKTKYFDEGKTNHRLIQESLCGASPHPLFQDVPVFDLVEGQDFDPRLHVERKFNSQYVFHGYVDGISTERKDFIDIKTGTAWSVAKFSKYPQFSLYAWALGDEYKTKWLLSLPRDQQQWHTRTIKVYNAPVTNKDYARAEAFLYQAIEIIENLSEYVKDDIKRIEASQKRSPHCYYIDCPICSNYDRDPLGAKYY